MKTLDATKTSWGATTISAPVATQTKPASVEVPRQGLIRREWFADKKSEMKRITKALEALGLDYDVAHHSNYGYDIQSIIGGDVVLEDED